MTRRPFLLISAFAAATVTFAQSPTLPPTLQAPRALPGTVTPPESSKLKDELEALKNERDKALPGEDPADAKRRTDRIQLRIQMIDLLKRIQDRTVSTPPPEVKKPAEAVTKKDIKTEVISGDVDPFKAAMNLFRSNENAAAYEKFKNVKLEGLSREDQAFVQYMTACCLRRLGKSSDAMVIFREVADEKADSFIAENAVWQISIIKSTLELEGQLEQLRSRKKDPPK